MIQRLVVMSAALSLVLAAGCGDDDNGNGGDNQNVEQNQNAENGDENMISFQISGEVEGQKEGTGELSERAQTGRLDFSFNDRVGDQEPTYSMLISDGREETGIPVAGEYELGDVEAGADYTALYTDQEAEDSDDYESYESTDGALIITESSEESISGTLEFEAAQVDDLFELIGDTTIEISDGEFTVPVN